MAGTTGLEPAASAVTVSGLLVLSTTWKSTDGTASHWKYVVDNVIVYRDAYRGRFCQLRRIYIPSEPTLDCFRFIKLKRSKHISRVQLTRTRGLPNAAQVVQDSKVCGLGCPHRLHTKFTIPSIPHF